MFFEANNFCKYSTSDLFAGNLLRFILWLSVLTSDAQLCWSNQMACSLSKRISIDADS